MSGEGRNSTRIPLIGVIDAGTRYVKFSIFKCRENKEYVKALQDVQTFKPQEGWHEQDPIAILQLVRQCIDNCLKQLSGGRFN